MSDESTRDQATSEASPSEPADFYMEDGFVVFTEQFHLRRGYCCNSGCRHCPYRELQ